MFKKDKISENDKMPEKNKNFEKDAVQPNDGQTEETAEKNGSESYMHDEKVSNLKDGMPDEEILYDLAELYKVFGDSTRIKILYVLFESEMCVQDISNLLCMTQSAISHQLRVLKNSKLVRYRRDGKTIMYSLADSHVRSILDQGLEHIAE